MEGRSLHHACVPLAPDRSQKLNVISFGVKESSSSITRADRQNHTLKNVCSILSLIDNSITHLEIRNTFRLGKFKQKTMPNTSKVCLNGRCYKCPFKMSRVTITLLNQARYRSPEERKKEKCPMGVRWSIQKGIEWKCIEIRNRSLLVNNIKLGMVDSTNIFQCVRSDIDALEDLVATQHEP